MSWNNFLRKQNAFQIKLFSTLYNLLICNELHSVVHFVSSAELVIFHPTIVYIIKQLNIDLKNENSFKKLLTRIDDLQGNFSRLKK